MAEFIAVGTAIVRADGERTIVAPTPVLDFNDR
jgi:hypothetical protein